MANCPEWQGAKFMTFVRAMVNTTAGLPREEVPLSVYLRDEVAQEVLIHAQSLHNSSEKDQPVSTVH